MSIEESEAGCSNHISLKRISHLVKVKTVTAPFMLYLCTVLLIGGIGCTEPGAIGLAVQPSGDAINGIFSDTTTLVASTILADSLRSDEAILTPLGSYIDPVFGYSTASFYIMYSLPTNNVNFGSGFTPDSLVMTFAYNGFYGPTPTAQTMMIYQLTESLDPDDVYYTSTNVAIDFSNDLGGSTLNPASTDASVSFKLNDPLFTSADSSFANNTDFQDFLKGFYVVTNVMQPGGMHYLDINASSNTTKLTLYYNDSMSFDFEIDAESAWFNRFHHNYAGTVVGSQLDDPSIGDTLVYIQPNQGVMVKLEMPYLNNWVKGNTKIAVNKAELVFPVYDDGTVSTFDVPQNLFILGAGVNTIITDQFEGAAHFGGTYDPVEKSYSFNIARYVHEVLYEGRPNDGILLIVPNNLLTSGSVVSANRVVLGGPKHTTLGMKLNMIYTEL
ncbi:MAG: DUF4270 domain-containing protein [Flavobacteriales bacterium]|nr:DUF4270 domain-containing protein [Flavobacteriales bacterium]